MFMSPPGEGCKGVAADTDPEPARGQPASPGGVLQRLGQAQEIHRVGLQHHRHELTHTADNFLHIRSLATTQTEPLYCTYNRIIYKLTMWALSLELSQTSANMDSHLHSPSALWIF